MHSDSDHKTDPHALTARIRAGDASAFQTLFRTHYGELCSFVHTQVGSADIAEEIVQDVLLRVWHNRSRLDPQQSLRPYLYRAARNHAINHLKRRRLEEHWQQLSATASPAATSTDDAVRVHELSDAIGHAVAALPERCRLIFQMSRDQGLSYAEIAAVLGISVKTVETQMGRALKALRTSLAPFRL
jgi:RNA polymerase sigma-70 factor (ECF subfamily)